MFSYQLLGGDSIGEALRNDNKNSGKKSSNIMRESAVRACASKLALCTRDFEESLFSLHQEVDHWGPDNDVNGKKANSERITDENVHHMSS